MNDVHEIHRAIRAKVNEVVELIDQLNALDKEKALSTGLYIQETLPVKIGNVVGPRYIVLKEKEKMLKVEAYLDYWFYVDDMRNDPNVKPDLWTITNQYIAGQK